MVVEKRHPDGAGGWFYTIFVPSLGREKQTENTRVDFSPEKLATTKGKGRWEVCLCPGVSVGSREYRARVSYILTVCG